MNHSPPSQPYSKLICRSYTACFSWHTGVSHLLEFSEERTQANLIQLITGQCSKQAPHKFCALTLMDMYHNSPRAFPKGFSSSHTRVNPMFHTSLIPMKDAWFVQRDSPLSHSSQLEIGLTSLSLDRESTRQPQTMSHHHQVQPPAGWGAVSHSHNKKANFFASTN